MPLAWQICFFAGILQTLLKARDCYIKWSYGLVGTSVHPTTLFLGLKWEPSGSVVECLTRDWEAAGSSLTGITGLCPWARHIYPSSALVQPRKTCPYITERLLMGRKESNQTKKILVSCCDVSRGGGGGGEYSDILVIYVGSDHFWGSKL